MSSGNDNFVFSVTDGLTTLSGQTFSIAVDSVNDGPTFYDYVEIENDDFEGGTSGWQGDFIDNNRTQDDGGEVTEYLGRIRNDVGNTTDQDIYKDFTLSGSQKYVTISFDMLEIDQWDNERFSVFINDKLVLRDNMVWVWQAHDDGQSGDVSWNVQQLTEAPSNLGDINEMYSYHAGTEKDQIHRYTLKVKTDATNVRLGFGVNTNAANTNLGSFTGEALGIDNLLIHEARNTGTNGSGQTIQVSEIATNGDVIGSVTADAGDAGQSVAYSITGGTGSAIFGIGALI